MPSQSTTSSMICFANLIGGAKRTRRACRRLANAFQRPMHFFCRGIRPRRRIKGGQGWINDPRLCLRGVDEPPLDICAIFRASHL